MQRRVTGLNAEELMEQVKRGYPGSVEPLVAEFYPRVLGYLYRMSGDWHLAEDLTQEAFLRLFRSVEQYRYPRPVKPWLFMIAANVLRDNRRKKGFPLSVLPLEDAGVAGLSAGEGTEEVILRLEEASFVESCLLMVNEIYREVLILRYLQDLTLNDIARVLEVPEGTVKSRLSRGLKELKNIMEKGGGRDACPVGF